MIYNFFRKQAGNLSKNGLIREQYIELYAKAMETLLAMIVNGITVLLIGFVLNMSFHCVVILAAFIPLRSYAGGYHARGFLICYAESCILLTAVLLFEKYFILRGGMIAEMWELFLVSAVIIFLSAPLADQNKPVSKKEAMVFKKKARIVLCLECVLTAVLSYYQVTYGYSVMLAVIICAFALVLYQAKEELAVGSGLRESQ